MTSIRQCTMNDLLRFNNVNLDVLTETYPLNFYMSYMTYWPESFLVAVTTTGSTTTTGTTNSSRSSTSSCQSMTTRVTKTTIAPYSCHISSSSSSVDCNTPTTGTVAQPPSSVAQQRRQQQQPYSNNSNSNNHNQGIIMGYLLGKAEGRSQLWHGHVSAITISKYYRRISIAKYLMHHFETAISTRTKHNYFVDLFVRASNTLAIQMYTTLGYQIYRTVLGYYQYSTATTNTNNSRTDDDTTVPSPESSNQHPVQQVQIPEDAYDMRKSLPRDTQQVSMIPLTHPIYPDELEW